MRYIVLVDDEPEVLTSLREILDRTELFEVSSGLILPAASVRSRSSPVTSYQNAFRPPSIHQANIPPAFPPWTVTDRGLRSLTL